MVGTLQPLDQKFAIVDAHGNPTDYFIRWAQQKQIDIGDSIQLSDLQAYLDAHQIIAGVGIQFAPGPNGDLNKVPTIHADVQAILDEISATRGIIIYRGLLGWAALLPGTAGNVLQTNGAGADPTWVAPAAGGSGALALLEEHTAAGSAALNFTTSISATYDEYLIEFINLVPATNAVNLYMRMSTNGGTSYDAGANYGYNASGLNRFGLGQTGVDSGGTQILLTKSAADNTATKGISGSIRLFSPLSTTLHKNVTGQLNIVTGGVIETQQSSGWYLSTTAVNAFQFLMSAGNIASGNIRVYGIAK